MLQILSITTPLFLLIGLGFVAALRGLINRDQIRGVGAFVINFALPALLFKALAERSLDQILDVRYLAVYALGSLTAFAAGFFWARRKGREDATEAAIVGMGMSVSNSAFIGYPMVAMVLGAPAAVAMALGMMVENLVMLPLTLALAEAGRQRGGAGTAILRQTARGLLRNPLLLAIVAGLICSLLQVRLPQVIDRSIDMLAQASAPAALFVIGATLYGLRVRGTVREAAEIAFGKLVLHPLLVGTALLLMPGIDPVMKTAGLLFASAPMFSVYPIVGQRYGLEERCTAALVLTTAASFFTMSVVLALAPSP